MAQAPSKLLLLAGATLMLAAFPALAQTNPQSGNMNAPATPGYSSGSSMGANPGMTPKSDMGTSSGGMHAGQGQDSHQTKSPYRASRGVRTDSQSAAVDRLNEQSLQAAQQGQNFMPGSSGSSSGAPTR